MTIYGRSGELISRCVECDLAEPESLTSLGGSAPGLVDGILSVCGVNVELRIGILDNWKVDFTDSKVTEHTINL